MKKIFPLFFLTVGILCPGSLLHSADWISDPSYYTHSPQATTRVTQYAPVGPFFVQPGPNYVESGYHHERSSIRVGDSSDNYVRVTRWGDPVRPYGEWQFPHRPYSVPYDMWGPAYPPFGFSAPYGYGPGPYAGFGFPNDNGLSPGYPVPGDTWHDRHTRPQGNVPRRDPRDQQFFYRRDETLRDPSQGPSSGPPNAKFGEDQPADD